MDHAVDKLRKSFFSRPLVLAVLILAIFVYSILPKAYGAQLPSRSLTLSDNLPSQSATYLLGFNVPATETLGSIELKVCSNDPIFSDVCTVPSGFDISSSILSGQTGETGFSIYSPGTNSNTVVLTRMPFTAVEGAVSYTFQGVINPSAAGTYYGRLQTFTTSHASGSPTDYGGIAFSINSQLQVSTTVPPYLLFCAGVTITGFDCSTATSAYVNFGNFTNSAASSAQIQILTATNADNGFTMSAYGTTMTSGNDVINAMDNQDVSRPGISQFGLNLVANQTPLVGQNPLGPGVAAPTGDYDLANWFKFTSGDELVSANQPSDYKEFTVSFIVNIPNGQPIGIYVTSLTYICLANF
ncbi:MAG: hypothetical protein ACREF5_02485 [Candidatus Saccharimonadales bacterium]